MAWTSSLDIDLGELAPGHHVVLRGIDLGHTINIERWGGRARE